MSSFFASLSSQKNGNDVRSSLSEGSTTTTRGVKERQDSGNTSAGEGSSGFRTMQDVYYLNSLNR